MKNPDQRSAARIPIRVGVLLFVVCGLATTCGATPTLPAPSALPTSAPEIPSPAPSPLSPSPTSTVVHAALPSPPELFSLCWVAYSPTNFDPGQEIYPPEESIRQDLQVLQQAGFTGLVTYSADDTLGSVVPRVAQELDFGGLIMGIWDPMSQTEREQAISAAEYPVTVGYVVGNEGLGKRYDRTTLESAMDELRQATGRPVATTEQIDDYSDPAMLALGDWVFPNAHPFFYGITEPDVAVAWTRDFFSDLQERANRPVLFKEVGLPTGGDALGRLDETSQAEYYGQLRGTSVQFVYFEAFDQPWKQDPPVEPFWGLFRSDRTPKQVVQYVCSNVPPPPTDTPSPTFTVTPSPTLTLSPSPTPSPSAEVRPTDTPTPEPPPPEVTPADTPTPPPPSGDVFDIYTDAESQYNHFTPSGFMGDVGDIVVNEVWTDNKHSGTSAIRITYSAEGKGPNECGYAPCKWAGVYWQNPPGNWGTEPDAGFDLRGFSRLTFWARSDTQARIEFKMGGIDGKAPYPDSLQPARSSGVKSLTDQWQRYEIDLSGADLSYVIGGFVWVANWDNNGISEGNPKTLVFDLDDIRFEK